MKKNNQPIVHIQSHPDEPMYEHCLAAWQGFKWLGYKVILSEEWLPHNLDPKIPVVGSVEFIQQLFKTRDLIIPAPLNIPNSLMDFSGRKVERTTLGEFLINTKFPAFVKPADTSKLWTGGVVSSKNTGLLLFSDYPMDTPVLVSPEVDFVSEYRIFVSRGAGMNQIGFVGMKHYAGDPFAVPNCDTIKTMIKAYKDAPRCYSLDVGVIEAPNSNHQDTCLVECNDFWALGTYGFDPVKYAEMISFRWYEMISNLKK